MEISDNVDIVIPLGDSIGTFTVETFAMIDGNCTQNHTTVVVEQPVRANLYLPPTVYPDDKVIGKLSGITSSHQAHITLTHNGQIVAQRNGNPINALSTKTPVELEFYVKPGNYLAKVEDSSTGDTDSIELVVGEPGKLKSYSKGLNLLVKDESINLKSAGALNLRLLPNIDTSLYSLMTAITNEAHQSCSEQAAAKILVATFMYLIAEDDGQRNIAEQIILTNIARQQQMICPEQGFALYPEFHKISQAFSKNTVRYLWNLKQLSEISHLSKPLRNALHQGLSLADKAVQAHHMQHLPEQIHNIEDAYTIATLGENPESVRQFIDKIIDFSGTENSLKNCQYAVADRTKLAYAAASLIAIGDLERGIKLANQVTCQFNEQGRLYSTRDSVAAIALMIQLRMSNITFCEAIVRVNNQEMTASEAARLNTPIKSIEVLNGVAAVEVKRIHQEEWATYSSNFPVKIDFRNSHDMKIRQVDIGERVDLVVLLPEGYQAGDFVQVELPASLSWAQGDSKIKLLKQDFQGHNELRIPLVVTSKIEGKQHFTLCVRNMFKEERRANPGILTIEGRLQAEKK